MKKALALILALVMVLSLAACGAQTETPAVEPTAEAPAEQPAEQPTETEAEPKDYSGYTIRIYSNSNSTERTTWLINEAKDAGFTISIDDNSVISGDTAAIQAANENKDGDILFGLNETRWGQVVDGVYENLSLTEWTPTWADQVGEYKYDGAAYGLVIQNVLMLYRTDEYGTNGEELHFQHWADIVDCGYSWYRQNKVGGTTNEIYNHSATEFVCNFIGDINRLSDDVVEKLIAKGAALDPSHHHYIRLERVHVNDAAHAESGAVELTGTVESREYYGLYIKYYINVGSQTLKVIERNDGVHLHDTGDTVSVTIHPGDLMSYAPTGEEAEK